MIIWGLIGAVVLSALLETRIRPEVAPLLGRPLPSWLIHTGSFLLLYALLVLVVQRPMLAMGAVLAFQLLLVLVNNAKYHSLLEPFVVQDFEYFLDVLRHPRLYLPFFGALRTLLASSIAALVIGIGFWLETPLYEHASGCDLFCPLVYLLAAGGAMVYFGVRWLPDMVLEPNVDLKNFGFAATLWGYGRLAWVPLRVTSNESSLAAASAPAVAVTELPNLVVVQSESFFDPRGNYPFVSRGVLENFDRICGEAVQHGPLQVPAWGANTVRTEAGFLTGLAAESLGVHRFNPYHQLSRRPVPSIASLLKGWGYRTVCIHPYPASFYARDRVLPQLGFEEFIDIEQFSDEDLCGQYVGDLAVARRVEEKLKGDDDRPLFIFVITMENHGPLHLERPREQDLVNYVEGSAPAGCADLTVYLRHLANADRMLGRLCPALGNASRPGLLCWYGDHVPILPKVFAEYGEPSGCTEYLIWSSGGAADAPANPQQVDRLGRDLLLALEREVRDRKGRPSKEGEGG